MICLFNKRKKNTKSFNIGDFVLQKTLNFNFFAQVKFIASPHGGSMITAFVQDLCRMCWCKQTVRNAD